MTEAHCPTSNLQKNNNQIYLYALNIWYLTYNPEVHIAHVVINWYIVIKWFYKMPPLHESLTLRLWKFVNSHSKHHSWKAAGTNDELWLHRNLCFFLAHHKTPPVPLQTAKQWSAYIVKSISGRDSVIEIKFHKHYWRHTMLSVSPNSTKKFKGIKE